MLGNSISGVIFDLDGTLADTSPDIAAALNAALRETGQTPLPVPDVISMIGDGIPTLVERAIARSTSVGMPSPIMLMTSGTGNGVCPVSRSAAFNAAAISGDVSASVPSRSNITPLIELPNMVLPFPVPPC